MIDKLPENDPRLDYILIGSDEIATRIDEVARQIRADYGDEKELCMVGVLKGACVFLTDLARALSRAGMPGITMAFVRASTYGSGIKGAHEGMRQVQLNQLGTKIQSKNILLIDDILDQGFTLSCIKSKLLEDYPGSNVKTVVFLQKILEHPSPAAIELRKHFQVDYKCFEVKDRWVVGYGLDAGEFFRELPYIAIAKEEYFV